MNIRPFQEADAEQVVDLHRRAVQQVCSDDYTDEQVAAWTDTTVDESLEIAHKDAVHRFVAVDNGTVIGFGEYNEDDREITGLYVDPDRMGDGAGTALLQHVEAHAQGNGIDELTCFSTITAKSFYESHGYTVEEKTMYEMDDCELTAYKMRKEL